MANPEISSYLQTKFDTANPEELTIITFDILISATAQAIAALKKPVLDIQAVHNSLRRGQRAAALLMGSLNFDIDKELGHTIFSIYEYWHHELFMANMNKSPAIIEQLLPLMKGYRETWTEANRRYRADKTAPSHYAGGEFVAVG